MATNRQRTFHSVAELRAALGQELGVSDWLTLAQERVDAFADATGDHQWIHVDVDRAKTGPFGTTIAHGYLTLSLLPMLTSGIFSIEGPRMAINYGMNRVRFPTPVKVGARVRARSVLASVEETSSGVSVVVRNTVEVEGAEKPACVAESVRVLIY